MSKKSKKTPEMLKEARDHFFEAYREIQPVIKALEGLVEALETFRRKVGHIPRYSLGLEHYRYSVTEAKKFKQEAYDTACSIGSLAKDGQD